MMKSIGCRKRYSARLTEFEIKSDTKCTKKERIKRQSEKLGVRMHLSAHVFLCVCVYVCVCVCVRERNFKCVSSRAPVDHFDTCLSISVTLMSLWKFYRLVQHPSWCKADSSQQNACNIKR